MSRRSWRPKPISLIIGLLVGGFVFYVRKKNAKVTSYNSFDDTAFKKHEEFFDDAPSAMVAKLTQPQDLENEGFRNNWEQPVHDVDDEIADLPQILMDETLPEHSELPTSTTLISIVTGSFEHNSVLPDFKLPPKPATCRHRWTKYLEQNQSLRNRPLEDALKRYVRLHDKHLRDISVEAAMNISLTSNQNKIRYLVWFPASEDIAGQLLSLVSAYLFALLTDRVLLVDLPADEMEHVICQPFPRSSWYLPESIKGRLKQASKALHSVKTRQPVRMAKLVLRKGDMQDDKHLLSCHGTLKLVFGHIQWLTIQSDYSFIESITNNRAHQNQLKVLFGTLEVPKLYAILHRQLIHPSNFVWEKITIQYHRFFSDHLPKPRRVVLHTGSNFQLSDKELDIIEFLKTNVSLRNATSVYLIPESHQKLFKEEIPQGFLIGSTIGVYSKESFLYDWRCFLTDVWMTSWTDTLILPEDLPTSSIPGLWLRSRLEKTWVIPSESFAGSFKIALPLYNFNSTIDAIDCSNIKRK